MEMARIQAILFLLSLLVVTDVSKAEFSCAGRADGFYASSSDCSQYSQCLHGSAVLTLTCPAGTLFNEAISNCDHTHNVDCPVDETSSIPNVRSSTVLPSHSSSGAAILGTSRAITQFPDTTILSVESDDAATTEVLRGSVMMSSANREDISEFSATVSSSATLSDDFTCSGKTTGYYPDPSDCSKYYHCVNGVSHHISCPAGTFWNQGGSVCDHTANVVCTSYQSTSSNKGQSSISATSDSLQTLTSSHFTTSKSLHIKESSDVIGPSQPVVKESPLTYQTSTVSPSYVKATSSIEHTTTGSASSAVTPSQIDHSSEFFVQDYLTEGQSTNILTSFGTTLQQSGSVAMEIDSMTSNFQHSDNSISRTAATPLTSVMSYDRTSLDTSSSSVLKTSVPLSTNNPLLTNNPLSTNNPLQNILLPSETNTVMSSDMNTFATLNSVAISVSPSSTAMPHAASFYTYLSTDSLSQMNVIANSSISPQNVSGMTTPTQQPPSTIQTVKQESKTTIQTTTQEQPTTIQITTQEPSTTTIQTTPQEPPTTPQNTSQEPPTATQEPPTTTQEPPTTTETTSQEPPTATQEPPTTTQEPPTTTQTTSQEPPTVTQEPSTIPQEPPTTTTKTTSQEQSTQTHEQQTTTQEPPTTNQTVKQNSPTSTQTTSQEPPTTTTQNPPQEPPTSTPTPPQESPTTTETTSQEPPTTTTQNTPQEPPTTTETTAQEPLTTTTQTTTTVSSGQSNNDVADSLNNNASVRIKVRPTLLFLLTVVAILV